MSEVCFLCNTNKELSKEHVFPKWLMKKYSLWEECFMLKNGTKIKYKNITVPCCKECNSKFLSRIEKKVQRWIEFDEYIDELILFKWTLKILLGVHYKETILKDNLKSESFKPIVDPKRYVENVSLRHMLLSVRNKVKFLNFKPYSLYIHNISDVNENDFFYVDEPYHLFISLQMGKKGVCCSFQDDGYVRKVIEKINPNKDFLHIDKCTFAEIATLMLDLKTRLKRLPNYIVSFKTGVAIYEVQKELEPNILDAFETLKPENYMKSLQMCFRHYFDDLIRKDSDDKEIINYKIQTVLI